MLSKDIEIVEPTDKNVYHFSTKELEKSGIDILPGSLRQALVEFRQSEFMKDLFGEQTWKSFYYAKLEEFDAYRTNVSQWERDRYIIRL